jgi:hypothetical protein
LPCSIRIIAATEVTAFVIEARRNMSFSPISAAPPTSRTPTLRAAVLEDQHHNARSAAAFDQSPKGFIKLRVARLRRKGQRHRGGVERERPEQSDHKTT